MSDSKISGEGGSAKKRNLPSWMSSKDNENKSAEKDESKLLEGVVFVLSGFVNPERATLRSQALEMGAEYRPDWTPDCTLLVCAYSNTPKFRQVEADCGTIVKKEWILECYSQKKLVEIDSYLLHAGKPWRKSNISHEIGSEIASNADAKASPPRKSQKQVKGGLHSKPTASTSYKGRASNPTKEFFFPSKVKDWVIDDLNRTISWLESQEEKPEASEIKQIAAEGILICLQDAIDFLEQNQSLLPTVDLVILNFHSGAEGGGQVICPALHIRTDVRKIIEQWNVVPHAVEEIVKLVDAGNSSASLSKEDLCRQAKACKEMYGEELSSIVDSKSKEQSSKADESGRNGNCRTNAVTGDAAECDSDETIEMTEEEIDTAYNTVASKFLHDK
ncbi:unnamed protein product [Dovyalis caffra]|uniref:BRCT domain-containing protein n=1 Tax=Dovyalis caffra TaxID=77055 RepID=A0AAV1SVL5_9ROSI|nr:unnamed protein product [Dovyalis caffra]